MSAASKKDSTYKMTPGIFEVESILQRGRSGNQIFYLIKWKGYPEQEATWEPQSNLSGCREAIFEFQKIIKQLEQQKSATESPPVKEKRKTRRDKERKFLTSQSKELSQEEVINSGHLKKTQHQPLVSEISQSKKDQNRQLQKLETQQQKKQDISSSSQNDNLEQTTAQTMQSNNADKRLALNDHLVEKKKSQDSSKSQINNVDKKNSQQTTQNLKKLEKSPAELVTQKSKESQLKRQRDKSEDSFKRNQKIIKKNKKQNSAEGQIQINNQSISHVQQKKIQTNITYVKKTQPEIPGSILKNEINSQQTTIKTQMIRNVKFQGTPIKSLSHRQILCEQEYQQLTIQMLGCLDSRLKSNLKLEQDQINVRGLNNQRQKFIDITNPTFSSMNQKIKKILLTQQQVQKLDKDGDFLYCDIEALLKITLSEKDEKHNKWVCCLKDHEKELKEGSQNQYFVKVNDLKSETWKKKFRKFLIPKQ